MATSGPRYPGTVATEIGPSGDNDWTSASNVGADDGAEAQITAPTYDANDHSYRLMATNFGFDADVPAGATINGITVEIDRRAFAGAAEDQEVRLYDSTGTLVGDDKQTATAWPATLGIATYGSASDTWTAGLDDADIRSAGFGVALIVLATAANTDIGVDFIRVTVDYTQTSVLVTPGTASLTLTPFAPTVTATGPFSDEFESNDLGKWSTVEQTNGTIATGTGSAHSGTYGVHIAEAADAAGGVYMRRTLTATDRIEASGWFRSPTEGAAGNNNANLRIFAGGVRIVDVYRQNVTGGLWLRTRNDAAGSDFTDTGQTRGTNVWYHFDVLVEYGGTGAVSRVKVAVDGTDRIDASTFDLDSGAYDMIQLGAEHPSQYVDLDADEILADRNPAAGMTVTPGVASLVLTPFAPVVTATNPVTVTPGTVALTLTPLSPTVTASNHQTVTPGTASLTLTPQVPTVSATASVTVTPGIVALTLTPQAPVVTATANVTATPGTASLTLTPFAPTATGGAGLTVTPGTLALALTAFAPSTVLTDHKVVTPGTASLVLTPFAPNVTGGAGLTVIPGTASLTLTAFAPVVTADGSVVVTPGVASLALTAFAPSAVISDHQTVTPGAASLALTPLAPVVTASEHVTVTPGTLALVLTTFAPTVSGQIVIGGAPPRRGYAMQVVPAAIAMRPVPEVIP